jgi:hypothetical protein
VGHASLAHRPWNNLATEGIGTRAGTTAATAGRGLVRISINAIPAGDQVGPPTGIGEDLVGTTDGRIGVDVATVERI